MACLLPVAPVAFEDAPLRACRAALSILQRLGTAGPELEAKHGVRPHLRIGLNTPREFRDQNQTPLLCEGRNGKTTSSRVQSPCL